MVVFVILFSSNLPLAYGWQAGSVASGDKKTLQERIPQEIFDKEKINFLTLTVENDSLGRGTDKNYTSGVRLSYVDIRHKSGGLIDWLDGVIPFFSTNETTGATFSIGQNLYTPEDITEIDQIPGTRPWAGFLYGSLGIATLTENHVDDAELTVGVVGPWAQGEEAQKFFHDVMGFVDPVGWDNQIDNEAGLILSWRRRWPQYFVHDFGDLSFAAEPNIGGSVGNVYTLAETGFTVRLAPSFDRWQDTPLLVKPSIPGSGFFQPQKGKMSWYLFGAALGRAVARNIFLDGNTFDGGYNVDKYPLVMDLNTGIALTFGDVRVSYTLVYRTREYQSQDDASLFGGVSVGYRF